MLAAVRAASRPDASSEEVYEQLGHVLREMTPLHEEVLSVRTEAGLRAINDMPADPPTR
ncbi:hypothetical protein [Kibdelosporangium philippinense]|uniref:hypothetical protein n=1 Tax=Kibdelosporangium philippinense TaxID=211113 RepID=UPI0036244CF0